MKRIFAHVALVGAGLSLSGCVSTIASTAVSAVALPVRAAGKAVDVATTSQSEADQKRGRQLRLREECIGKEMRRAEREGRQANPQPCEERYPL